MTKSRRSLLAPEVMQTSLMDCGPAALKAVLAGFGIDVNYDLLRERCETDVDGTSIDALAMLGRECGLQTYEVLVSRDSFLLPEASCLPAIVVTRSGGGQLHFIVVWNVFGSFVQIMDPGSGRRFMHKQRFLELMPDIPIPMSARKWRSWADTENARAPLRARMRAIGVDRALSRMLLERAGEDASFQAFATLDAGIRMVTALVESRALHKGPEAAQLLERVVPLSDSGRRAAEQNKDTIPKRFWWVTEDPATPGKLVARGSVVVHFAMSSMRVVGNAKGDRASGAETDSSTHKSGVSPETEVKGRVAAARARAATTAFFGTGLQIFRALLQYLPRSRRQLYANRTPLADEAASLAALSTGGPLPEDVQSQLAGTLSLRPMKTLWRIARFEARSRTWWVIAAMLAGALVVPAEALLLRSLLTVDRYLALDYQRAAGIVAVLVLIGAGLWLELWTMAAVRRIGLGLETRLRIAFLEKLPRLEDKYLRSRPSSDMAGRGHAIHIVREIPVLWAQAARVLLTLLATAAGLVWLFPNGTVLTLVLALVALVVPLAIRRSLFETSTRLRTHSSALDRFYLDALMGVSPIRVHGAERAVRCEHEQLLTEWGRTAHSMHAQSTGLQAVQLLANTGIAAALVIAYVKSSGGVPGLLLVAFWALRMPIVAQELAVAQLSLRSLRSVALRLLAPLAAPEVDSVSAHGPGVTESIDSVETGRDAMRETDVVAHERGHQSGRTGVRISLDRATVRARGHILLRDVSVDIPAGSHLAVVGISGAGKSSLLGLFLGLVEPSEGQLRVDGETLSSARLARLRDETAWVDPGVRLWDQSLYDNLVYGDDDDPQTALPEAVACADLLDVLEQLPEGMQANLGEGGVRVSGGQGQRVRLGRALMRKHARLVILDEPFRGLERTRRHELLRRVREHWQHATLLFVSHDVEDALEFDRVLVLDAGRIIEDGAPRDLVTEPSSRYAELASAERILRAELWSGAYWRRQSIQRGQLLELDRT